MESLLQDVLLLFWGFVAFFVLFFLIGFFSSLLSEEATML